MDNRMLHLNNNIKIKFFIDSMGIVSIFYIKL